MESTNRQTDRQLCKLENNAITRPTAWH